jgi:hypothetical protein
MFAYLSAWEIRPGIHSQVLDPSAEELNPPGGKKGVLVNTATPHMGVHEDRKDFEKELKQQNSFQSKTG